MAGSCKAAAVLSDCPAEECEQFYNFGKHFGIAFQVMDDILDFTSSTETLGKPAGSDLKDGNITAPVLFALEEKPQLHTLIARELKEELDLTAALALIEQSTGIDRAKDLAKHHTKLALQSLESLPPSPYKKSLLGLAQYNIDRIF